MLYTMAESTIYSVTFGFGFGTLLCQTEKQSKYKRSCQIFDEVGTESEILIKAEATIQKKTLNQRFLTFETILDRTLIQF